MAEFGEFAMSGLAALGLTVGSYLVALIRRLVMARVEETVVSGILDQVTKHAETVVTSLEDTRVKEFRDDAGKLGDKMGSKIKDVATAFVLNGIGPKRLEKFKMATGVGQQQVLELVGHEIETAVAKLKKGI